MVKDWDAGRLRTTGRGEFAGYLVSARCPFDRMHVEIQDIIAEGDRVAVRYTYHLTLEGEESTAAPAPRSSVRQVRKKERGDSPLSFLIANGSEWPSGDDDQTFRAHPGSRFLPQTNVLWEDLLH